MEELKKAGYELDEGIEPTDEDIEEAESEVE